MRLQAGTYVKVTAEWLCDATSALCICPAGHKLYRSGQNMLFNGYRLASYKAPITACRGCHLREHCLRHPDRTPQRQLTVIKHPEGPRPRKREHRDGPTRRMRWKLDTPLGREIYSRRMGTLEPVFANIQNKGMRRFTLRGQSKVSARWKLFMMVHNIEKVAGAAMRKWPREGQQGPSQGLTANVALLSKSPQIIPNRPSSTGKFDNGGRRGLRSSRE